MKRTAVGNRYDIFKNALVLRSKNNIHRYLCFINGRIYNIVTNEKEFLKDIPALLFGNYNGSFATPASNFVRVAACVGGVLGVLFGMPLSSQALPTGHQSVSGNVQFNTNGSTLNVNTQAQRSIAQYQTFNISHGETVNFNLPNAQAAILNRVVGGSPSQIMGAINSNGKVFLVNNSGIVFGATAQVNVGSLFASSLDIGNQDFLEGRYVFQRTGSPGMVVNHGNIQAADGGFVVLAGAAIENTGTITAPNGHIHMAVGDQVSMMVNDSISVDVTVDEALQEQVENVQNAVNNTGMLSANGGSIVLEANLSNKFYDRAVNNEGQIEALSVTSHNGKIILHGQSTTGDALVRNAGTLDASGIAGAPNGGEITLQGDYVVQKGTVLAEGADDGEGGSVLLTSSKQTVMATGSTTSVKGAGNNSDGGTLIAWSDDDTYFMSGAKLDVGAGAVSGDGGFAEVSAVDTVYFNGTANGKAPGGQDGIILIDPTNIRINSSGGSFSTGSGGDGIVLSGDADLGAGESVFDPATFGGFGSVVLEATQDITVEEALTLAGANVDMRAGDDISVLANITTGGGDLFLQADYDFGGGNDNIGAVSFGPNVTLSTSGGDIEISSAQGITLNNAQINAGAGDVTVSSMGAGNITQSSNGLITGNHISLRSGSGNIGTEANPIDVAATSLNAGTSGPNVFINSTGNITVYDTGGPVGNGGGGTFKLSASGNINFETNAAGDAISLITNVGSNGNIVIGNGGVINLDFGDQLLYADGTGTITIANSASLRGQGGEATLAARDIIINGAVDMNYNSVDDGGEVILAPNGNVVVNVGGAGGMGGFEVQSTELAKITASSLQIGSETNTQSLNLRSNISASGMPNLEELELVSGAGNINGNGFTVTVGDLSLGTSSGNVGSSANRFKTNVNHLQFESDTGSAFINEANAVGVAIPDDLLDGETLADLTSTGSTFDLVAGGNVLLGVMDFDNKISIKTTGNILDGDGLDHFVHAPTIILDADGYVGTTSAPIEVGQFTSLSIGARSQLNGVSVSIAGATTDQVTQLNTYPGSLLTDTPVTTETQATINQTVGTVLSATSSSTSTTSSSSSSSTNTLTSTPGGSSGGFDSSSSIDTSGVDGGGAPSSGGDSTGGSSSTTSGGDTGGTSSQPAESGGGSPQDGGEGGGSPSSSDQSGGEGGDQAGGEGGDQAGGEGDDQAGGEGGDQAGGEGDDQAGGDGGDQAGDEGSDQASDEGDEQSEDEGGNQSGGDSDDGGTGGSGSN